MREGHGQKVALRRKLWRGKTAQETKAVAATGVLPAQGAGYAELLITFTFAIDASSR